MSVGMSAVAGSGLARPVWRERGGRIAIASRMDPGARVAGPREGRGRDRRPDPRDAALFRRSGLAACRAAASANRPVARVAAKPVGPGRCPDPAGMAMAGAPLSAGGRVRPCRAGRARSLPVAGSAETRSAGHRYGTAPSHGRNGHDTSRSPWPEGPPAGRPAPGVCSVRVRTPLRPDGVLRRPPVRPANARPRLQAGPGAFRPAARWRSFSGSTTTTRP